MSETFSSVAQDPPTNEDQAISPAKIPPIDAIAVDTPDVSTLLVDENVAVSITEVAREDQAVPGSSIDESLVALTHHADDNEDEQQQQQVITQLPPSTTQAEEDARLSAQEDQQRKAEEEARIQAEHELLRQEEEEIAKQQAEEEARIQADHEPERLESEAVTRTMAEEQARIQAEQEPARWEAEAQARSQAEEEARLQAERGTNDVLGGNAEEPATGSSSLIDQPDSDVVDVHEPLEYPNVTDGSGDGERNATIDRTPEDSKKLFDTPVSDMVAEIVDLAVEQVHEMTTVPPDDAALDEIVKGETQESTHVTDASKVTASVVAETVPISANDETANHDDMPESGMLVNEVDAAEVSNAVDTKSPPPAAVVIGDETIPTESSGEKFESTHGPQATDSSDTPAPETAVDNIDGGMMPADAMIESPSATANLEGTMDSANDLPLIAKNEEAKEKSSSDATATTVSEVVPSSGSFSQAVGGLADETPSAAFSTPKSEDVGETPLSTGSQQVNDDSKGDTSLTASGATKTTRVSTLVSKYMDNVTGRESLTGDPAKFESSSKSLSFSPTPSPVTQRASVELQDLPKIDDIRAKFEGSAKSSQPHVFEFGEAFRQKQRFSLLADREKKKEAQMKLHGYDELIVAKANGASGEVDSSSIEKTFSFQTSNEDVSLHDGTCKIDYTNETYKGMVFVVHRTRGMLVFNRVDLSGNESNNISGTHIPGGPVSEEEFLTAAQQTGYAKMQLQLAAREGAARELFETTGIDIRQKLDRLTPAVLQTNPSVDAKGTQYLKNEHENNLYYFLQISDDDFVSEDTGDVPLTTPNGEANSPLKLRLSRGFADFTFIKDPLVAVEELNENGDPSVTAALSMVMNQSVGPNGEPAKATTYEGTSAVQTVLVPRADEDVWTIGLTTVRGNVDTNKADKPENTENPIQRTDNEADLRPKASVDSEQEVVVDCCCGSFW